MLCVPKPSLSLIVAVPALVNCAVPSTAPSSQSPADALQNFTNPGNTAVVPLLTVAVNVTAVPAVTLVDDTLNAVVIVVVFTAWAIA